MTMVALEHSESPWQAPPQKVDIAPGDTHLWLYQQATSDSADLRLLSQAERQRAERMGRSGPRTQYVFAQCVLRQTLARYLQVAPQAIALRRRSGGKPELASEHQSSLGFNLSHSGDLTLVGVSLGLEIGVDVERHREVNALQLANRFFCAQESARLEQENPLDQQRCFFGLWTAKEALAKAMGQGLANTLNRYCIQLQGSEAQWQDQHGIVSPQEWKLQRIPVAPDYSAAFAVAQSLQGLRYFTVR